MVNYILTYDQWVEALNEAEGLKDSDVSDALSTQEWIRRFGRGRSWVNKWIDKGLEEGWLELLFIKRPNRTGFKQHRPVYRVIPQKEQPPQKKRRGASK